jgi:hypothetical protein
VCIARSPSRSIGNIGRLSRFLTRSLRRGLRHLGLALPSPNGGSGAPSPRRGISPGSLDGVPPQSPRALATVNAAGGGGGSRGGGSISPRAKLTAAPALTPKSGWRPPTQASEPAVKKPRLLQPPLDPAGGSASASTGVDKLSWGAAAAAVAAESAGRVTGGDWEQQPGKRQRVEQQRQPSATRPLPPVFAPAAGSAGGDDGGLEGDGAGGALSASSAAIAASFAALAAAAPTPAPTPTRTPTLAAVLPRPAPSAAVAAGGMPRAAARGRDGSAEGTVVLKRKGVAGGGGQPSWDPRAATAAWSKGVFGDSGARARPPACPSVRPPAHKPSCEFTHPPARPPAFPHSLAHWLGS